MATGTELYPSLDTPAILLDLDTLEANIKEMSQLARDAGLKLRPHIKIHESATIAKMQLEAGAIGIEVGSIDQVEALADAGIKDILVAHPFYGSHKLGMLERLLRRGDLKLTFVIEMLEHAQAISGVAEVVGLKVPVVIKLDTGGDHLGALPGEPVHHLAKQVLKLRSVELKGIYGHEVYSGPTQEGADKEALRVAEMASVTAQSLRKEGIEVEHVSVGASSTFRSSCQYIKNGRFREINEIHPGKIAVDDIAQAMMQDSKELRRTVTVLATVISASHPDYAVIDAGFKTFGFDALIGYQNQPNYLWQGKSSFGRVKSKPDLWFGALHAEVGVIFYKNAKNTLRVGERLEIFPNNTTLVIHINKELYGVREGEIKQVIHAAIQHACSPERIRLECRARAGRVTQLPGGGKDVPA